MNIYKNSQVSNSDQKLLYYQILVPIPIDKPLVYSIDKDIKSGVIVKVPVMSKKQYGIIAAKVDIDYLAMENIPVHKVKQIDQVYEHCVSQTFLEFLRQIAAYNMQLMGDVVANAIGNFAILTEKSRLKKQKPMAQEPKVINLSLEQRAVCDSISSSPPGFAVHVIDGVTGGGKTMVYLDVILRLIQQNPSAQVLICLPEISLTPQTKRFFEDKLGYEPQIWHSGISKAQKKHTMRDILGGLTNIIVGTRSAILLEFKNLKMIVIDEEHDQSYKQNDNMIYSGRDMAIMRSKILNIPIILSSATPAIETYANCETNRYKRYYLTKRYSEVNMPQISIIDMSKRENRPRTGESLSPTVIQIAKNCLEEGSQVLFFLNRRGFSSSILCGECKSFIECANCSVNMAYHQSRNLMLCHYCGHSSSIPGDCNSCQAQDKWIKIGFGVEKINDEIKRHFPDRKTQIFSSDEVDKNNMEHVLADITSGKTQIIVGTQMISKGYNFPKLKCVVIVDTDTGFLDGDFRIYEKTYQNVVQVAGRAGRFDTQGLVIIQTYQANNPTILRIADQDKERFYKEELQRRNSKYNPLPPFSRQISIVISSSNEDLAKDASKNMVKYLYDNISHIGKIFGPAPSLVKRINRQYRFRILLSLPKQHGILAEIRAMLLSFKPKGDVMIKIDVDPTNFI